jgi:uncharacterized membrane protein YfcA
VTLDPLALSVAVVAVSVGAYVRGYSGFGSSLIWISGMSIVFAPVVVVPAVYIMELVASARLVPFVWRDADWRSLRWLIPGACLGLPPGLYLLSTLPPGPVRVAIALVVVGATIVLSRGFALKAVPGSAPAAMTGVTSGIMNGWTGIGGPPVIVFYFSSPVPVAVSRASLIVFLFVLDVFAIALAGAQALVTTEVLVLAAILSIPVLIGISLGHRRFIQTPPETFRRLVVVLLGLLSLGVLARAILG